MKLQSLALVALLALTACSTTSEPEVAMMPVSECEARTAEWKEKAMMYKEKADSWYEQAQAEQEKNRRLQEEYNSCFRK